MKSIHCGYDGKIPFRLRIFKFLFFCENQLQIVSKMFSETEIMIRQVDFEICYWIHLPEVRHFVIQSFLLGGGIFARKKIKYISTGDFTFLRILLRASRADV